MTACTKNMDIVKHQLRSYIKHHANHRRHGTHIDKPVFTEAQNGTMGWFLMEAQKGVTGWAKSCEPGCTKRDSRKPNGGLWFNVNISCSVCIMVEKHASKAGLKTIIKKV